MMIWSRLGFLVAVFVFGCSLIANLIANHLTGSAEYWNLHKWPFGVSLLVSALLSWTIGSWLADSKAKALVVKDTGEKNMVNPDHTLFFIKMHWWGPILFVTGVVLIAIDLMKQK